jgi:hypothetical protein
VRSNRLRGNSAGSSADEDAAGKGGPERVEILGRGRFPARAEILAQLHPDPGTVTL